MKKESYINKITKQVTQYEKKEDKKKVEKERHKKKKDFETEIIFLKI